MSPPEEKLNYLIQSILSTCIHSPALFSTGGKRWNRLLSCPATQFAFVFMLRVMDAKKKSYRSNDCLQFVLGGFRIKVSYS